MTEKLYYSWEDFEVDVQHINQILKEIKNPCIVTLYRGGLPLGVTLSNQNNLPLSIIDFQSRDGDTKEAKFIKKTGINKDSCIVLVDDIYDSGLSVIKAKELIQKEHPENEFKVIVLHHNQHASHLPDYVTALEKSNGLWVVYPWEAG